MCKPTQLLSYLTLAAVACFSLSQSVHASDEQALEQVRQRANKFLKQAKSNLLDNQSMVAHNANALHRENNTEALVPLEQYLRESEGGAQLIPVNVFTKLQKQNPEPKAPEAKPAPKAPAAQPAPKAPEAKPAPAPNPGVQHTHSHVSSIGMVCFPHAIGTGTYIGDNIVITAAHVISGLFDGKSPKGEGPHYYDIRNKHARWYFDPKQKDVKKYGHARYIPVVGMVAESIYINGVQHGIKHLSSSHQKVDIAFLILDPQRTKDLPTMDLITDAKGFQEFCAMMGYAKLKGGGRGRHKVAVKLGDLGKKDVWDIIRLKKDFDVHHAERGEAKKQAEGLLDTFLPQGIDMVSDIIRSGDSGGPLIVKTSDGRKVQIGVNSVSTSDVPGGFSGCASLITGSAKAGWVLSPKVREMLDFAKAKKAEKHPK